VALQCTAVFSNSSMRDPPVCTTIHKLTRCPSLTFGQSCIRVGTDRSCHFKLSGHRDSYLKPDWVCIASLHMWRAVTSSNTHPSPPLHVNQIWMCQERSSRAYRQQGRLGVRLWVRLLAQLSQLWGQSMGVPLERQLWPQEQPPGQLQGTRPGAMPPAQPPTRSPQEALRRLRHTMSLLYRFQKSPPL